jgi:hypothetical protein
MLTVDTGSISIEVDPEHGGRIVSLLAHDREWLAPAAPSVSAPSGRVFDDGDYAGAGWDEVVPTVHACVLPDGTTLQDHGDAWRLPWDVLEFDPLRMEVELKSLPVTVTRTISAADGTLLLHYSATTSSASPVPLLWSAHPLFAAPAGTRIVVPDGEMIEEYPERGRPAAAPESIDSLLAGTALKTFVRGGRSASIVHADGAALTMSWSPMLAAVGFYWDTGEFSDAPVVAIEPTTGAGDRAADVLAELPTVSRHAPLEWWLSVSG